jgi:hypothetical protein
MACDGSFGHQAQLAMVEGTGTPASWAAGKKFSFQSCTLAKHGRQILAQGMTGSRSARFERLREGPYSVAGSILLNVSPGDLDMLLPWILGADEVATDTFGLAEDLQEFAVALDTEEGTFIFTDCKVDTAVIRGQQPGLMEQADPDLLTLELRIVGKTFIDSETAFDDLSGIPVDIGAANKIDDPYIFADTAFSLNVGATVAATPMSFALVIRNFLQPRFVNSLTATNICPGNIRQIGLRIRTPWNATHGELLEPGLGSDGASTLTITNGGVNTVFTFHRIAAPNKTSTIVRSKGELYLDRDFRAYAVGSTKELSVTNDITV